MAQWKHKINIKQYIRESGTSDAEIVIAATGVLSEIKKLPESLYEEGLFTVVCELEDIISATHDPEDNEYLLESFNEVLNDLYNWADYERVWLGM